MIAEGLRGWGGRAGEGRGGGKVGEGRRWGDLWWLGRILVSGCNLRQGVNYIRLCQTVPFFHNNPLCVRVDRSFG